jgi:hypothetical protein
MDLFNYKTLIYFFIIFSVIGFITAIYFVNKAFGDIQLMQSNAQVEEVIIKDDRIILRYEWGDSTTTVDMTASVPENPCNTSGICN